MTPAAEAQNAAIAGRVLQNNEKENKSSHMRPDEPNITLVDSLFKIWERLSEHHRLVDDALKKRKMVHDEAEHSSLRAACSERITELEKRLELVTRESMGLCGAVRRNTQCIGLHEKRLAAVELNNERSSATAAITNSHISKLEGDLDELREYVVKNDAAHREEVGFYRDLLSTFLVGLILDYALTPDTCLDKMFMRLPVGHVGYQSESLHLQPFHLNCPDLVGGLTFPVESGLAAQSCGDSQ